MKQLHWEKITSAGADTLWSQPLKDAPNGVASALGVTEKDLETLFGATKVAEKAAPRDAGAEKLQLIDMRRANHCEIMLKQIKAPLEDVFRAVQTFDEARLDADTVSGMLKFVPEPDEAKSLRAYQGDLQALGRAERFMLTVLKCPRWGAKLGALQYRMQFRVSVARVTEQLETIALLSEEVRKAQTLPPVMQAILSVGNVMNAGTAKGAASGFRLASLEALTRTRSGNGKTTLLHYLCKARVFAAGAPAASCGRVCACGAPCSDPAT